MRITFHYIETWLNGLSLRDRAVVMSVFQEIQIHGLSAIGCKFRRLERKLWEIKIRGSDGSYRFFYVMVERDHMHILHQYKKQSQKTPLLELELARKRLKEVMQ
jgi:phage-related protein